MSIVSDVFNKGRKALIGYITVGHPEPGRTVEIAQALDGSGCDIIELGIPFSDPLGDGPTIQHSSFQALQNGTTPEQCLETAAAVRKEITTPLLFMTYYNPIMNYGDEAFFKEAAKAGVNGFIIPDVPPEEGLKLEGCAAANGLDYVYLLAPTSTDERIKEVARHSTGFIYLVSLTGVTGARESLPPELESFVRRVRSETDKPLAVGFGISTPEHARRVAQVADGIIVGSRIIQLIDEDLSLAKLRDFLASLRKAIDI
jgi:tryptophan synthase alpha chain